MGDIIPPCLTPLPTRNSCEAELPIEHTSSDVYTGKTAY